jgi:hypothetical protein
MNAISGTQRRTISSTSSKVAQFIAIALPVAIAQRSLGYGVNHLDADPRLTVIPRTESTELGEHARRP